MKVAKEQGIWILLVWMVTSHPESEEAIQLAVNNDGQTFSTIRLVLHEPDFPAVSWGFIVDDLTTTFGPSPLLAFQSVPTVVSCFFIAVLARLRHFRRIHDCANRQPPN